MTAKRLARATVSLSESLATFGVIVTKLDQQIRAALATIGVSKDFDMAGYGAAFHGSAEQKAQAVLEHLTTFDQFKHRRPVFVSIGGADGWELRQLLLHHPTAVHGVLIEGNHELAELARANATQLTAGKSISVYEGDALVRLGEGLASAAKRIPVDGDFLAVSCHAVLHELPDRGSVPFNPLDFFSDIFNAADSVWFTYREPGVPSKWPEAVLLKARCSPDALVELARAICAKHSSLGALSPRPSVTGDHARLNRVVAMEVLCKLFYLDDLAYEIQERSTSVEHEKLVSQLWLAIGDRAKSSGNAQVTMESAPTGSFVRLWGEFGVEVEGLMPNATTMSLSVAESQTRVVAWRQRVTDDADDNTIADLSREAASVAQNALAAGDEALVTSLLVSYGRRWIESENAVRTQATALLTDIASTLAPGSLGHCFAYYLQVLLRLFGRDLPSPDAFSGAKEADGAACGLDTLFAAERMELQRKNGDVESALQIANSIIGRLPARTTTTIGAYAAGVVRFLVANLLRHGGAYAEALPLIREAQSIFNPGTPSHATEIIHCLYAEGVCSAMLGTPGLGDLKPLNKTQAGALFAGALVKLANSHAAWSLGNADRAVRSAVEAAEAFSGIESSSYAARARLLVSLLRYATTKTPQDLEAITDPDYAAALRSLLGDASDLGKVGAWLADRRVSMVLGFLELAKATPHWQASCVVPLPKILIADKSGVLSWKSFPAAESLRVADEILRGELGIPLDRRLPLIAD